MPWRLRCARDGTRSALNGVFCAVGTELFYELVVQSKNEKRRRPLPDEKADVLVAHQLHRGRHCHRTNRHPQKHIRRKLRSLLFDRLRDLLPPNACSPCERNQLPSCFPSSRLKCRT